MSRWYLWTKYLWFCGSSPSTRFSLTLYPLRRSQRRVFYHHFSPTTQSNGYCQIRWAKLRSQHKKTTPPLPPSKPSQPLRNSLIYSLPTSGQHRLRSSLLYSTPNCPRLAHRLSMRSSGKRNLDIILLAEATPQSFGRENHSYGRMNRDVYQGSWASVRSAVKRLERSKGYVSILGAEWSLLSEHIIVVLCFQHFSQYSDRRTSASSSKCYQKSIHWSCPSLVQTFIRWRGDRWKLYFRQCSTSCEA